MASEVAKRIDEVIRLGLTPALEADGYLKKSRTFHRVSDDCVRVVNVQASDWNDPRIGRFTLNLGVFFPQVDRIHPQLLRSGLPNEAQCTVRMRIGELMPGRRDTWWDIEAGADPAPIAEKIGQVWLRFGRPWIERVADLREARALAIKLGWPLHVIAMSLVLGERADAERRMAALLRAHDGDPARHAELAAWARAAGLSAPR